MAEQGFEASITVQQGKINKPYFKLPITQSKLALIVLQLLWCPNSLCKRGWSWRPYLINTFSHIFLFPPPALPVSLSVTSLFLLLPSSFPPSGSLSSNNKMWSATFISSHSPGMDRETPIRDQLATWQTERLQRVSTNVAGCMKLWAEELRALTCY